MYVYICVYIHANKYPKHICTWEVYIHISGEVPGILTQLCLSWKEITDSQK